MTKEDVAAAARQFLAILSEPMTPELRERRLIRALDQLALAYHFAEAPPDSKEYPPVDDGRHDEWQRLHRHYGRLFPDFGWYNTTWEGLEILEDREVVTGDALDDLADITLDLREFLARWERTSHADALQHFRESFEYHWGRHLRDLQKYLHHRAFYRSDDQI